MSQLLLDENIDLTHVLPALQRWITVKALPTLRPDERVLDDRVPTILRTLKGPTFLTIDHGFWQRRWCHPNYCIIYFDLRDSEQRLIPGLLRALFHHPEFHTRAARMGKVACVGTEWVRYWQFQTDRMQHIALPAPRRRKKK
jgi:hypothetical protein